MHNWSSITFVHEGKRWEVTCSRLGGGGGGGRGEREREREREPHAFKPIQCRTRPSLGQPPLTPEVYHLPRDDRLIRISVPAYSCAELQGRGVHADQNIVLVDCHPVDVHGSQSDPEQGLRHHGRHGESLARCRPAHVFSTLECLWSLDSGVSTGGLVDISTRAGDISKILCL